MRTSSQLEEIEHSSSLQTSPKSSTSENSNSSCNSNGVQLLQHHSPPTPKLTNKADPTTFIQADTSSFKHLVQMLTGSSQTVKQASKSAIPPIKTGHRKQPHKLYERRNSFKNLKVMSGLVQNCGVSPRELEMLSPSMLDFPSLVISPVTPLTPDPFNRSPTTYTTSKLSVVEKERVIEDGFYLHPSPITTPRDKVPRLLPLFPLTSPKVASTSS